MIAGSPSLIVSEYRGWLLKCYKQQWFGPYLPWVCFGYDPAGVMRFNVEHVNAGVLDAGKVEVDRRIRRLNPWS